MKLNKKFFFFLVIFISSSLLGIIDLEEKIQNFILETKQIEIPNYPFIFNPSIVRWENKRIMSFRIRQGKTTNKIGLIWLDSNFTPQGEPYILKIQYTKPLPLYMGTKGPKEQDSRLIIVDEKLYVTYSHYQVGKMLVSEIEFSDDSFIAKYPICLLNFEGSSPKRREKNWVPFEYNDELMLGYSIFPHKILRLIPGTEICETYCKSFSKCNWKWGEIYGGTPALKVDDNYLGFFHSSIDISTVQSQEEEMAHYFMGAYLFSASSPFKVTHISPEPIIAKNFYCKHNYKLHKRLRVIFPAGFVFDEDHIWIFYGRHDNEVWFVKLDKIGLYNSLTPI